MNRLLLAIGVVAAAATGTQDPPLAPEEVQKIQRWLNCIDCLGGELDTVRALGAQKPGATVDTLKRVLFGGPQTSIRQQYAAALRRTYVRDSSFAVSLGEPNPYPPRDTFVVRFLNRFDVTWRLRAVTALGWINTPRADSALDSASLLPLHPRVLRAARFARDSLPTP